MFHTSAAEDHAHPVELYADMRISWRIASFSRRKSLDVRKKMCYTTHKCEDQKEVPQFPHLHREAAVGESRRGETGNTFCEQRTKRILSNGLIPFLSFGGFSVGCAGAFPLQDRGIGSDSQRFGFPLWNMSSLDGYCARRGWLL